MKKPQQFTHTIHDHLLLEIFTLKAPSWKLKNSLSRFGVRLWNEIPCHIRDRPKKEFTKVLHELLSDILKRENDYIETPLLIKKVGSTVK